MPSPSIVQVFQNEIGYGPASPVTVVCTGVTPGNSLVVVCMSAGDLVFGTPSDGANTYSPCPASDFAIAAQGCTRTFYTSAVAVGGTITISCPFTTTNPGYTDFYVYEVSGAIGYETGKSYGTFNAGPAATGAFSVAQANSLVLLTVYNNSGTPASASAGYTIYFTTPNSEVQSYKKTGASAESPSCALPGGAAQWIITAASFYPTGSPFGGCAYDC